MKNLFKSVLVSSLVIGLILAMMGSAEAVVVTPTKGKVYVNQGNGFQLITEPVDVPPGTKVAVSPDGGATIARADGTLAQVSPGDVVEVTGNAAAGGTPPATGGTPPAAPLAINPFVILGGIAVVGGVVALASSGGSNNPSSP